MPPSTSRGLRNRHGLRRTNRCRKPGRPKARTSAGTVRRPPRACPSQPCSLGGLMSTCSSTSFRLRATSSARRASMNEYVRARTFTNPGSSRAAARRKRGDARAEQRRVGLEKPAHLRGVCLPRGEAVEHLVGVVPRVQEAPVGPARGLGEGREQREEVHPRAIGRATTDDARESLDHEAPKRLLGGEPRRVGRRGIRLHAFQPRAGLAEPALEGRAKGLRGDAQGRPGADRVDASWDVFRELARA